MSISELCISGLRNREGEREEDRGERKDSGIEEEGIERENRQGAKRDLKWRFVELAVDGTAFHLCGHVTGCTGFTPWHWEWGWSLG